MAGVLATLGFNMFPAKLKDRWKSQPGITKDDVKKLAMSAVDKYDAFVNLPWPLFYEHLANEYPDAKFILTIRDTETWIKSVTKHFAGRPVAPFDLFTYGGPFANNQDMYIQCYEQHNKDVQQYFANTT